MKKICTTFFMSLFLINAYAGISDSTEILRQCLNLEELQTFFQKHENGDMKPIVLMEREVVFDESFFIQNPSLPIVQMSRDQIVNELIETFLMFRKFEVANDFAIVQFGILCGAQKKPHLIEVMIEFKKVERAWEISSLILN